MSTSECRSLSKYFITIFFFSNFHLLSVGYTVDAFYKYGVQGLRTCTNCLKTQLCIFIFMKGLPLKGLKWIDLQIVINGWIQDLRKKLRYSTAPASSMWARILPYLDLLKMLLGKPFSCWKNEKKRIVQRVCYIFRPEFSRRWFHSGIWLTFTIITRCTVFIINQHISWLRGG